jgi:hypothetical protein
MFSVLNANQTYLSLVCIQLTIDPIRVQYPSKPGFEYKAESGSYTFFIVLQTVLAPHQGFFPSLLCIFYVFIIHQISMIKTRNTIIFPT